MIESELVRPAPTAVYWFYSEWQPAYSTFPDHVHFIAGMPTSLDEYGEGPRCVVFDDLMTECADNSVVREAFVKKRHHANMSVVLIVQNLFCKGREMRNIHLNTQYLVLFATPRDKSQFHHFARQVEPRRARFVTDAYTDAVSKPYGYLLVDLKPHTPDVLRYRTDVLQEEGQVVYVPRLL